MALLKWLRKRRGKHAAQKEAAQEKTLPFENAPEVVLTPNEQVVNDFLHIINSQGELAQFVDPDANIRFKETPMTFAGFQEEMGRIFESLPDFKLNIVGPIKEQSDGTVLANMFATGTHTGKPYSFGPFPEIDSKGAAITLDPEDCFYTVRDGKIVHLKIIPLGDSTGPPGVYTKLGGLIF